MNDHLGFNSLFFHQFQNNSYYLNQFSLFQYILMVLQMNMAKILLNLNLELCHISFLIHQYLIFLTLVS